MAWDRNQVSVVTAWAASRLIMTLHTRIQSQAHVGFVVNKRAQEEFLRRAV
jgi:hypothetical protein